MKKRTARAARCIQKARQTDELFPCVCMDIVCSVYGKALDKIKYCDIYELIETMMGNATDDYEGIAEYIDSEINAYMNG